MEKGNERPSQSTHRACFHKGSGVVSLLPAWVYVWHCGGCCCCFQGFLLCLFQSRLRIPSWVLCSGGGCWVELQGHPCVHLQHHKQLLLLRAVLWFLLGTAGSGTACVCPQAPAGCCFPCLWAGWSTVISTPTSPRLRQLRIAGPLK